MDRRALRDAAFRIIFEADFQRDEDLETLYSAALSDQELEDNDYLKKVFFGVNTNIAFLDEKISENAHGWKLSRISRVSLSIMRLAIYEMLNFNDIPYAVSINEAVELSKKYDEDSGPKFINGILNSVAEKSGLKDKK